MKNIAFLAVALLFASSAHADQGGGTEKQYNKNQKRHHHHHRKPAKDQAYDQTKDQAPNDQANKDAPLDQTTPAPYQDYSQGQGQGQGQNQSQGQQGQSRPYYGKGYNTGGDIYSTSSMTCMETQNLVEASGQVTLAYAWNNRMYRMHVVAHQGYCGAYQSARAVSLPTADVDACFVGYMCEASR